MLPLAIGAGLALFVGFGARLVGWDRDRAFYSTVLVVVATYYALFAVMGGSVHALGAESLPIAAFTVASVVGFRRSMWLVAAGLVGHGIFDLAHGQWIENPGVPVWWPRFCMAYDVTAGAFLAWLLARKRIPASVG
jgi:hypothetical protein